MSGCGTLSFTLCFGLDSPISLPPLNFVKTHTNCFTSGISLGIALGKLLLKSSLHKNMQFYFTKLQNNPLSLLNCKRRHCRKVILADFTKNFQKAIKSLFMDGFSKSKNHKKIPNLKNIFIFWIYKDKMYVSVHFKRIF